MNNKRCFRPAPVPSREEICVRRNAIRKGWTESAGLDKSSCRPRGSFHSSCCPNLTWT